jgi:hypothetical protein
VRQRHCSWSGAVISSSGLLFLRRGLCIWGEKIIFRWRQYIGAGLLSLGQGHCVWDGGVILSLGLLSLRQGPCIWGEPVVLKVVRSSQVWGHCTWGSDIVSRVSAIPWGWEHWLQGSGDGGIIVVVLRLGPFSLRLQRCCCLWAGGAISSSGLSSLRESIVLGRGLLSLRRGCYHWGEGIAFKEDCRFEPKTIVLVIRASFLRGAHHYWGHVGIFKPRVLFQVLGLLSRQGHCRWSEDVVFEAKIPSRAQGHHHCDEGIVLERGSSLLRWYCCFQARDHYLETRMLCQHCQHTILIIQTTHCGLSSRCCLETGNVTLGTATLSSGQPVVSRLATPSPSRGYYSWGGSTVFETARPVSRSAALPAWRQLVCLEVDGIASRLETLSPR